LLGERSSFMANSAALLLLLASAALAAPPWPPNVPDPSEIGCNLDPNPPFPPFAAADWPPVPTPKPCVGRCPNVLFIVAVSFLWFTN
jgi:hypothetical protein